MKHLSLCLSLLACWGHAVAQDPAYVIGQDNLPEHAQQLSDGHRALLTAHASFRMQVDPPGTMPAPPAAFIAATQANAGRAKLDGIDNVIGAPNGIPFPQPQSGAEVIWNQRLRWRGTPWRFRFLHVDIKPDAPLFRLRIDDAFKDARPIDDPSDTLFRRSWRFHFLDYRQRGTNQDAGIWYESLDMRPGGRQHWGAFATTRVGRHQLIPSERHFMMGYLLRPYDMIDMYMPPYRQYTFKLLGQRTLLMPFAPNWPAAAPDALADLLTASHPNMTRLRYQPRAVWVVEANLRDGERRQLARRVFYVDAETWEILLSEHFNADGAMALLHECHLHHSADAGAALCRPQFLYELADGAPTGRYMATNLREQDQQFTGTPTASDFNPKSVARRRRVR